MLVRAVEAVVWAEVGVLSTFYQGSLLSCVTKRNFDFRSQLTTSHGGRRAAQATSSPGLLLRATLLMLMDASRMRNTLI